MKTRQIAIDGSAGAGKSTLGSLLAPQLGYLYIDTGAMYRAITWLALSKGVEIHNGPALANLTGHTEIVISRPATDDGRQYTILVNGRDVTWDIRDVQVTRSVPYVSGHSEVRALLITQQRSLAQGERVVMVGRDIGTVVLPDAELKIFLDASPEERAHRHYAELVKRLGEDNPGLPSMEEILEDIRRRDELDCINMKPASDAVIIRTDEYSPIQLLEYVCSKLEEQETFVSTTMHART